MTAPFVDFANLKTHVRIEHAVQALGLVMRQNGPQWRGACPACKQGGERALAVNTEKQSYYCFSEKKGGDLISLAAHIRGESQKDAAHFLAQRFGNSETVHRAPVHRSTSSITAPPAQSRKPSFDAEAYAKTLDPAHAALEPLGVSSDTLRQFKAGYSAAGINRGRLALPVHDRSGAVVCYCGRSLTQEQQPTLIFPNGVNPVEHIFNAHNVREGALTIVRDPLGVLQAYEHGVENVVAFLTEISPQSLEQLAALMDEKKCPVLDLA